MREQPPFIYPLESLNKTSKESQVKKFIIPEGQEVPYPIVKEIRLKNIEDALKVHKAAYNLLATKKYGFVEFMPKTQFVIGRNEQQETVLYVLQQEIHGNTLKFLINRQESQKDVLEDIKLLLQVDDLLAKSLTIWRDTATKKRGRMSLPKAISSNFDETHQYITVGTGEGVMPEVHNLANLMVGKIEANQQPKLYFVDNHSVIVFPRQYLYEYGLLLDNFTPIINKLREMKYESKSIQIYGKLCDEYM